MSVPIVVSLSGGKDSTAMLHILLERGERVHSAVFFDGGWDFPEMLEHIEQLRRDIHPVPLVVLKPRIDWIYWMLERPVVARSGPNKGKVAYIGAGWPTPIRRWCTRDKAETIDRYMAGIPDAVQAIGLAKGEEKRTVSANLRKKGKMVRFPLIEWGMTEPEALAYCKGRGYSWGGLYDHFHRLSCFCCPLSSIPNLRVLRAHFPHLLERMLGWEAHMRRDWCFWTRPFNGRPYTSLHDIESRFAEEDRSVTLPGLERVA